MYRELHDAFGGVSGAQSDFSSMMKRLLDLKLLAAHGRA
jgi:hypothetical protein